MATQIASETRIDEVADGIFRISTPVDSIAGGGITVPEAYVDWLVEAFEAVVRSTWF